MRENVKKLIDIMEAENWPLYVNGWKDGYAKTSKSYPRLSGIKNFIATSNEHAIDMNDAEIEYFNEARTRIWNAYQKRQNEIAEAELAKYLETKK